jgi:DNA invertase Pin-like site-specific DNA recombinase
MALIGYARVSTDKQDTRLQMQALQEAGCEEIFEETASGAKQDRPELKAMLKFVRKGDTVVIWKLNRLASSMAHLVSLVDDFRKKGIDLKVLTGAQIDTTSVHGRLIFGIFAALAEWEKELINERTKAGMEKARTEGRIGGRPRISDNQIAELRDYLNEGKSWRWITRETGLSPTTISKYAKELKLSPKPPNGRRQKVVAETRTDANG